MITVIYPLTFLFTALCDNMSKIKTQGYVAIMIAFELNIHDMQV